MCKRASMNIFAHIYLYITQTHSLRSHTNARAWQNNSHHNSSSNYNIDSVSHFCWSHCERWLCWFVRVALIISPFYVEIQCRGDMCAHIKYERNVYSDVRWLQCETFDDCKWTIPFRCSFSLGISYSHTSVFNIKRSHPKNCGLM